MTEAAVFTNERRADTPNGHVFVREIPGEEFADRPHARFSRRSPDLQQAFATGSPQGTLLPSTGSGTVGPIARVLPGSPLGTTGPNWWPCSTSSA